MPITPVYPVSSGTTTHTGTYTPEIWSGKTLIKFYISTVFGAICNTDYEGEIKNHGDTVKIRTIPDITIRDYVIGQKLQRERPLPGVLDLLINKGKYYSIAVNDVEKRQSDIPFVDKWTDDAGRQMAIKIDLDVLSNVYADANANNKGLTGGAISGGLDFGTTGTPFSLTKANILDKIVDMGTALNELNVPQTERWVVFPAIFCGMILKSDLKDASLAGDGTSIMRNGRVGMIDKFMIYDSNQVAQTTDGVNTVHNSIFGQREAITFAAQLVNTRYIDNPDDFGKLLEGLNVYGYKVKNPEALGHFYAAKG